MPKTPVVSKMVLDSDGSPFLEAAVGDIADKFDITSQGLAFDKRYIGLKQRIMFDDHPHEWPLDSNQQPKVKLEGQENSILFIRKKGDQIEFQFFVQGDDPSSEATSPVFKAELPSSAIVRIMAQIGKNAQPKAAQVFNRVGGNIQHRSYRKVVEQTKIEIFDAQSRYLMKVLSPAIGFNKGFMQAVIKTIEGLTLHENKRDLEDPTRKFEVGVDLSSAAGRYTN